ncbi:hypothetical protein [Bradyrhizobium yuanmingense]
MAICACEVKLDGAPLGKVVAGKYAYADRPPGVTTCCSPS